MFYQNAYPVTAIVYGFYLVKELGPTNLASLRDRDFSYVAQRILEQFENAFKRHGLTATKRQKRMSEKNESMKKGATIGDVAKVEKILKSAIILRVIVSEDIYNRRKYQSHAGGVELIVHNGYAWSKESHFPQNVDRFASIMQRLGSYSKCHSGLVQSSLVPRRPR